MKKQTAVFIQAYITPGKEKELEELLKTGGNPLVENSFFPIDKINNVHFARWIIAPSTEKFQASLIYSANVDGDANSHLEDLATNLHESVDRILAFCEEYPEANRRTINTRLTYLKKNAMRTPAFYVGAPNRSVQQIKDEAVLHSKLRDFVQTHGKGWQTRTQAYKAIKSYISDDPELNKLERNGHLPKRNGPVMILFLLLVAIILPFVLLMVLCIFLFYEPWYKPFNLTINDLPLGDVQKLKSQEDRIYQNQLSQVFETKPGVRKWMLKFMLWATNFAAKHWFVEGELMGTPTIHFARWVFIDGGKRFVFFSNFDGSYDNYLGDFVDNNGWGLNAIYGAAKGYPRTHFVFGGGSYKILEFMGWGRKTQVTTPIWYSAYPWWGLQQIVDRTKLRSELLNNDNPTEEEMKQTLSRI